MENDDDRDYEIMPEFEELVMQKMIAFGERIHELNVRREAAIQFIEAIDRDIMIAMQDLDEGIQFIEDISNALLGRPLEPR